MKNKKPTEIKVLNIAQPNAHNVMFNGKNVENRNIYSTYRGTIAIYGSKTFSKARFEDQDVAKEDCSFGCIIGFVDMIDCITEDQLKPNMKKWFHGPYGYILENVVLLKKPVEITPPQGAVVWWTLEGDDLQKCLDQLPANAVIQPLSIVKEAKGSKKPKLGSKTRLCPTPELAKVIGSEPVSYKHSIQKLSDYLDEHGLTSEENGKYFINADSNLRALFGKKKIPFEDVKTVFMEHLKESKAA